LHFSWELQELTAQDPPAEAACVMLRY